MDPSPEVMAQHERTITALCIILTLSWAAFIGYLFVARKKSTGGDRLALIDSEFSMAAGDDKPWAAVPASPFANPSI